MFWEIERLAGHSHKHTDVLVWFSQLDQLCEAALHNAGGPLVHLTLTVVVTTYNILNTLAHTHTQAQITSQCLQSHGSHWVLIYPEETEI